MPMGLWQSTDKHKPEPLIAIETREHSFKFVLISLLVVSIIRVVLQLSNLMEKHSATVHLEDGNPAKWDDKIMGPTVGVARSMVGWRNWSKKVTYTYVYVHVHIYIYIYLFEKKEEAFIFLFNLKRPSFFCIFAKPCAVKVYTN